MFNFSYILYVRELQLLDMIHPHVLYIPYILFLPDDGPEIAEVYRRRRW